eukprot:1269753-Rhodomonas_salina.1
MLLTLSISGSLVLLHRYIFRAESAEDCKDWVQSILDAKKKCLEKNIGVEKKTVLEQARDRLKEFYDHHITQTFVTLVIVANFVVSIVGAQMAPEDHSKEFRWVWYASRRTVVRNMRAAWYKRTDRSWYWERTFSTGHRVPRTDNRVWC